MESEWGTTYSITLFSVFFFFSSELSSFLFFFPPSENYKCQP